MYAAISRKQHEEERKIHESEIPRTAEEYEGFYVYDLRHEKVGKVADAFSGSGGRTEYIGLKTGLFGSKSALVPAEAVRINEERRLFQVGMDKKDILAGPTYDDPKQVDQKFEDKVLAYYGVDCLDAGVDRLDASDGDLGPDVAKHGEQREGERSTKGERDQTPPLEIRVKKASHERIGLPNIEPSSDGGSMEGERDGRVEGRVRIHDLQK